MREYNTVSLQDAAVIAAHLQTDTETVVKMVEEALDWNDMGEYVLKCDHKGVYVTDIANMCGEYTIIPISYEKFRDMCLERLKKKI